MDNKESSIIKYMADTIHKRLDAIELKLEDANKARSAIQLSLEINSEAIRRLNAQYRESLEAREKEQRLLVEAKEQEFRQKKKAQKDFKRTLTTVLLTLLSIIGSVVAWLATNIIAPKMFG